MMSMAEKAQALAPEQYGSQKRHRSSNLATNKSLTNDLLRKLKSLAQFVPMMLIHVMI
jgi:hypothetical protein